MDEAIAGPLPQSRRRDEDERCEQDERDAQRNADDDGAPPGVRQRVADRSRY